MTEFHEGQEVEVLTRQKSHLKTGGLKTKWRKAKIINVIKLENHDWCVEFPDGSRGIFKADYIRTADDYSPHTKALKDALNAGVITDVEYERAMRKHVGVASDPPTGTILVNFD